jgi:formyl-CoA transferase
LQIAIPDPQPGAEDRVLNLPGVASPIRYSETPIQYALPPPRLGQHTDDVLREKLELDAAELERLHELGILGSRNPG